MASVNKVIIIGNVGRDPEVRYSPSGAAVCNLSVATSRNWKSKETGERQEETEWHRVVLYDRQAEVAGEYLKKGRSVYIEGRLKTRKWADKDGVEKHTTEIVAEQMTLLGGRDDDAGDDRQEGGRGREPAPPPRRATDRRDAARSVTDDSPPPRRGPPAAPPAGRPAPPTRQQAKSNTGFDDMDDDTPF